VTQLLHAFLAPLPSSLPALIQQITSHSARPGPKLRLLTTIYNTLPQDSAMRCDVFEGVVEVAAKGGDLGVLEEWLPKLEGEMNRWGIDQERQRKVYTLLADRFEGLGEAFG